jgi:hypothetical protein
LANNAIDTASATSNLTLSLSTYSLGPYNENDIYRIEEPKSYHHDSKVDIAD